MIYLAIILSCIIGYLNHSVSNSVAVSIAILATIVLFYCVKNINKKIDKYKTCKLKNTRLYSKIKYQLENLPDDKMEVKNQLYQFSYEQLKVDIQFENFFTLPLLKFKLKPVVDEIIKQLNQNNELSVKIVS